MRLSGGIVAIEVTGIEALEGGVDSGDGAYKDAGSMVGGVVL